MVEFLAALVLALSLSAPGDPPPPGSGISGDPPPPGAGVVVDPSHGGSSQADLDEEPIVIGGG